MASSTPGKAKSRESAPRDKIMRNWKLDDLRQVTRHPPTHWSRECIEAMARLSSLCDREQGIAAIATAYSERDRKSGPRRRAQRHVGVRDIHAAIDAINKGRDGDPSCPGHSPDREDQELSEREREAEVTPERIEQEPAVPSHTLEAPSKRKKRLRDESEEPCSTTRSPSRTWMIPAAGPQKQAQEHYFEIDETDSPPTQPSKGKRAARKDEDISMISKDATSKARLERRRNYHSVPRTPTTTGASLEVHKPHRSNQHLDPNMTLIGSSSSADVVPNCTVRRLFEESQAPPIRRKLLERVAQICGAADDDLLRGEYNRIAEYTRLPKGDWQRLHVPRLWDEILTGEMRARIVQELRSYVRGRSKHLWSPNDRYRLIPVEGMFHSLFQQTIREDPLHYLLMVAMQPDGNHKLQSYPLCVEMHRGADDEGFFARFNEDQPPEICFKLVHELTWRNSTMRELVTFHFRSVMVAGQALKNELNLDPAEVARINAECMIPPDSVENHSQHPAVVPLPACSSIGAALAGTVSWDSPSVEFEVQELMGPSLEDAKDFVKRTREMINTVWIAKVEEFEHRFARTSGLER